MDKRFIIIHPSEVVRKGLWAILRESYHSEFILLSKIDEINDYSGISNFQIIVLIDKNQSSLETFDFVKRVLTSCNEITFITVSENGEQAISEDISINQSGVDILKSVKSSIEKEKGNSPQLTELSEREKDVLGLVALGHSNKEIAEKLFISIHTVITHRKHITDKLGIKSISGLTVYAILNKLIDTENIDPSSLI